VPGETRGNRRMRSLAMTGRASKRISGHPILLIIKCKTVPGAGHNPGLNRQSSPYSNRPDGQRGRISGTAPPEATGGHAHHGTVHPPLDQCLNGGTSAQLAAMRELCAYWRPCARCCAFRSCLRCQLRRTPPPYRNPLPYASRRSGGRRQPDAHRLECLRPWDKLRADGRIQGLAGCGPGRGPLMRMASASFS
jgi:hypothetical protein